MHYRILTFTALTLALSFPSHATYSLDERKDRIKAMDANVSAEALERKTRSVARLTSEGVPINGSLPVIENTQEAKHRSKDEVAWRAMALLLVAVKGEGLEQSTVLEVVEDYGLERHFTPEEKSFIFDPSPSEHQRIQFAWRYEAAWVLLWSLGYVESLGKPTGICDVPRAVSFLQERTQEQFIADATLRPIESILDQTDLIYRYHWAVVDARVKGEDAPASLHPGVTMERHHALNWLIGYMEQEWDDVSTDT